MLRRWFIIFLLIPVLAPAQSQNINCRSWSIKKNFEQEAKEDRDYKSAIEKYFQQHSKKSCPDISKGNSPQVPPHESMRCISTKGIAGLESLPCFNYQFVKARGEAKGTIIYFQGGPGDIFEPFGGANSDYNEIAFNDIGVGDNSLALGKGVPWKVFSAANQAEILQRILKKENVTDYVLSGGSFGTVTATQVGAELSRKKPAPKAVLLAGVVPSVSEKEQKSGRGGSEVKIPQTGANPDFSRGCVLKGILECVDHEVLKLLTSDERIQYQKKIAGLAKGSDQSAFRALVRDAFHWEFAHGPKQGADFLRRYILADDHVAAMNCWYNQKFLEIPWINRYKSASQLAFYQANNCYGRTKSDQLRSQECACLPDIQEYHSSNFQIKPPTKIYYINGDVDSQTPIEGAEQHFNDQKNSEKAFLKICGGGHMPLRARASREDRTVSDLDVYRAIFSGDLKTFRNIDGYCNDTTNTTPSNSAGSVR
ncbi:MAG: hypothetical protein JNM24_08680 [Bdellovibrionaceae bacterium]|nr:hypothetical protein [Pseudobdellovibrionaceae bacterium]